MSSPFPLIALLVASTAWAQDEDPLLLALEQEMARTMGAYADQEDPPYFLGYRVEDLLETSMRAKYGALASSQQERRRTLDVTARVGSHQLDSSHPVRGEWSFNTRGHESARLPADGDALALRAGIWRQTALEIQAAQEMILRVRANRAVKVEETDPSPDFSHEEPQRHLGELAALELDRAAWEDAITGLSGRLVADPVVENAWVRLDAKARNQYIVTSEGTRIREPRVWLRIAMLVRSTAEDGMQIDLYRWKDVHDPSQLPPEAELAAWTDELLRDHTLFRQAPKGEPYSGPVLMRGSAAGVFIHEVLGHRAEGHRQKDEDEGQTFREQVGQQVMLDSITIFDDPTMPTYAGEHLNGHYRFDEEGQPATRSVIVQDGVFRGFLMNRSPIKGFDRSNGHGRAMAGRLPVARMGSTVVESADPRSSAQLRAMLLDEARSQDRDYGILIDEIGGGFTMTGRTWPNSFNIRVETAWRVYVDGRPDEPIRGIDLVGTPLVALGSVVAAGDDPAVFNGFCGAESGSIPNSAISPSLLIRQVEVQRKEKDQDRPPLLPRPEPGGES